MNANDNDIARLIAAYYDGALSAEEERELRRALANVSLPQKYALDRDIILAMSPEAVTVPDDLEAGITAAIDDATNREMPPTSRRRHFAIWISAAAVVALLIAAGAAILSNRQSLPMPQQQPITANTDDGAQPQTITAPIAETQMPIMAENTPKATKTGHKAAQVTIIPAADDEPLDATFDDADLMPAEPMPTAEEVLAYETAELTLTKVSALMCRTMACINYDREE